MQRYFAINNKLQLGNSDKHHIINVMRMKVGDTIEIVFDRKVYLCKLNEVNKYNLIYEIVKEKKEDNELKKKIIVAFSLVNETKTDFIIQKCTELGVYSFIPIITERSKIKIGEKENKKIERWNKIAKESSEQSHRNIIPTVSKIYSLNELIKIDADLKILCSTKEKEKNIKKLLQNSTNYDTIILVVGPEGGISEKEETFLNLNGFNSVTFGNTILRTETAPIFAVSAIKYEFMR